MRRENKLKRIGGKGEEKMEREFKFNSGLKTLLVILTLLALLAFPAGMVFAGSGGSSSSTMSTGSAMSTSQKTSSTSVSQVTTQKVRKVDADDRAPRRLHVLSVSRRLDRDRDRFVAFDKDWALDAVNNPAAFTRTMDRTLARAKSLIAADRAAGKNVCSMQVAYGTLIIAFNNFENAHFKRSDIGSRHFRGLSNMLSSAMDEWSDAANGTGPNLCQGLASTGSASTAQVTVMLTKNARLGDILTDSKGMTLYIFKKDKPGMSSCTGSCAQTWLPYTVPQGTKLVAGSGVTGKLGLIKRSDGTFQVTINNMPLYRFVGDTKAGETNGQAKFNFWFTVNAAGAPVMKTS